MQELKKMKIWICWNHTLTRDNKPTKKPLSANGTTTGTNEKYRSTWVSYEEATISAKEHGFNGVGFIIPEGYYFLDIDHRNTEDALTQTYSQGMTPTQSVLSANPVFTSTVNAIPYAFQLQMENWTKILYKKSSQSSGTVYRRCYKSFCSIHKRCNL